MLRCPSRPVPRKSWWIHGAAFMITDMNSTNGTIVSGARLIGSRQLIDRDRVTIGNSAFALFKRVVPGTRPSTGERMPGLVDQARP